MHVITVDQLTRAVPLCRDPAAWTDPLNQAMLIYGISDDTDCMVEWLAQCAHESSSFNRLAESLSYTPERLMAVWPKRFPTLAVASQYAGKPQALAEYVYGGRNGNTKPGDGWNYRGRGLGMITFADNYTLVGRMINDPLLVKCPDRLCTKSTAALASAAFWAHDPKLAQLAADTPTDDDYADFVSISKLWNGGTVGLAERAKFRAAFKASLLS